MDTRARLYVEEALRSDAFPSSQISASSAASTNSVGQRGLGCCEAIEVPGNIEMSGHVEEPNSSSGEELDLKEKLYSELRGLAALVSGLNGSWPRGQSIWMILGDVDYVIPSPDHVHVVWTGQLFSGRPLETDTKELPSC